MADYLFENQYVRDLAWALGSPPLMRPSANPCRWFEVDWYQQLLQEAEPWLRHLEQDHAVLDSLIKAERDQRLGRYFELLWQFWFEHSLRYDVIAHNLQLQHERRTIGELDMVIYDRETDRNIHLEFAVKFYLGLGDTRLQSSWHGPNRKDRLDLKMDKLLNKQSVLAKQQRSRQILNELGLRIDECAVIMKGRLFYPWSSTGQAEVPKHSHPDHLRCRWLSMSQLDELEDIPWCVLKRRGWLAASVPNEQLRVYTKSDIDHEIRAGALALPLIITGRRETGENPRRFIVPDGWSTTL